MFSFVKSFFIAPPAGPDDESDGYKDHGSTVEDDENVSATAKDLLKEGKDDRQRSVSSSSSSCRIVQKVEVPVEGLASKQAVDVVEDSSSESSILWCQLFAVQGLEFECVMERGYADVQGRLLVVCKMMGPAPSDEDEQVASWRLEKLLYLRQHQEQSFQVMVGNARDNAQEFGLMFRSPAAATTFRQLIWPALLATAQLQCSLSCAIASYDHRDKREFSVLSLRATASLWLRPSDGECFFCFGDLEEGAEHPGDLTGAKVFVCGNVSLEAQFSAARPENKLSLMATPYREIGNGYTLFLVEFLPAKVGTQNIDNFFLTLGKLLRDRTFAEGMEDCLHDEMSDEDFDLGDMGDENVQAAWREPQSSQRRQRTAEDDDRDDNSAEDYGDEQEDQDTPQRYKEPGDDDVSDLLSHRFMDVGTERTFVCRAEGASAPRGYGRRSSGGNLKLSVYRRSEREDGDDELRAVGTVDGDKFAYKGQHFTPTQGLLHSGERQLVVTAPDDHGLYLMDIEAEKVVQKFDTDGQTASAIFAARKFGGATPDPTFLASNTRSLFLMDSRANGRGLAYDYTTNPQLTTGATDSTGHICIASRLGELRLFDGQANTKGDGIKRAKTLLTTVKEPITAVDVTKDGAWLVATTKTFLIVFCTRLKGSGRTGFETALGQHKPAPRYLMLNAEDLVRYEITDINFAPARFDQEEECIVTSTGNMAVVWDFGTVKRGKPFYSVRFAPDTIRDVQVSMENNNVVVAYPSAVALMATEKRQRKV